MNQIRIFKNAKGAELKHEVFECTIAHNIPIYIGGEMIGRALIVEVIGQEWEVLLDIYIYDEENRGKGYGTQLLDFVKTRFSRLITNARTPQSKQFLLKNGFEQKKGLFKNTPDMFFYRRKEEENATD